MRNDKNRTAIGSGNYSAESKPIRHGRLPCALIALCLLVACSPPPRPGYPPFPDEETPLPQPEEAPAPEIPEEPVVEPEHPPRNAGEASGPAVLALLSHAETQTENGELDRAAATVERALDVEPRNPFVYHRLAELRLAQDQPGQAEALARKSNSLAGDNPYIQSRNWTLIARARRMRGDNLGADAAAARAEYYRGRLPE